MPRPLRLAFARIAQETNALSPVPTTLDDFRAQHLLEGPALLQACGRWATEAEGFIKNAELSGFVQAVTHQSRGQVELVPLFSAWAVPAGPLTAETHQTFLEMLRQHLSNAGPLDGVYLCLHGAMGVAGVRDPETEFLRTVRQVAGQVPLAVSYDLHGNLTRERVALADFTVAYRTNPHRDHASTGARAGTLLWRMVRHGVRPVTAWRSLPMLLGGGTTLDFLPPMRSIFQHMKHLEAQPRVLSASTFMCHMWNSDPDLGWSTLVTTNGDADLAERLADDLAERCWGVRHHMPPEFSSAADAVAQARAATLARRLGVVVLSDASDVVTAGSTGENTRLIAQIIKDAPDLLTYAAIRDAAVVDHLWSDPLGTQVQVRVGGKMDPARNDPLQLDATVLHRAEAFGFKRQVVLGAGNLRLVVTEGPAMVMKPSFFTDVGLPILKADVVVVKNFFPFRIFFLPYARKTIYVKTGGITDVDASFSLPFTDAMHPRDLVDSWRPADRRRRGLASASVAAA